MSRNGFTLLELMVSMAILSVVSLLGFIVVRSSYEGQTLIEAQGLVSGDLRAVMAALTSELELAYMEPRRASVLRPEEVENVEVSEDGHTITFYRPVADESPRGYRWEGPIRFTWLSEDLPGTDGEGNAVLDEGEDANGNGVLDRHVLRIQGEDTRVIGAANTISRVEFELLGNEDPADDRLTSLRIRVEASAAHGPGNAKRVRSALESRVRFINAGAAS